MQTPAIASARVGQGTGTALISPLDGPHPSWDVQIPAADGLLDFKRLDVVVVKEVIETPAVKAVLVGAEVLGVR